MRAGGRVVVVGWSDVRGSAGLRGRGPQQRGPAGSAFDAGFDGRSRSDGTRSAIGDDGEELESAVAGVTGS